MVLKICEFTEDGIQKFGALIEHERQKVDSRQPSIVDATFLAVRRLNGLSEVPRHGPLTFRQPTAQMQVPVQATRAAPASPPAPTVIVLLGHRHESSERIAAEIS